MKVPMFFTAACLAAAVACPVLAENAPQNRGSGTNGSGTSAANPVVDPNQPTPRQGITSAENATEKSGAGTNGSGSGALAPVTDSKALRTTGRDVAASDQPDTMMDHKWVAAVASGNTLEIQLGQLAKDHASRQDVKEFAQKMIEDHTKASEQLKQAIAGKGIQIPGQLNEVDQAVFTHMSKLEGRDFDRHYIYGNVAGHTKMYLMFRDGSNELNDAALRQFAAGLLPTIDMHLQMAQKLANMNQARTASEVERGVSAPSTPATAVPGHATNGGDGKSIQPAGTKGGDK